MGHGSYGTVVLAKCKHTKKSVAIKLMKGIDLHEYNLVKTLREIQLMRILEGVQLAD